jgi:hypothetical protein
MARELTELEQQFKRDAEREFPGYYDFTPYIVGFLKEDTRNAFVGWQLALADLPIYPVGAMVRFKGDPESQAQVVHEVVANTNETTYGVGGSWWHEHDDLVFVSGPTDESRAAARQIMEDSADDEDEDDEDEDDEDEDDDRPFD